MTNEGEGFYRDSWISGLIFISIGNRTKYITRAYNLLFPFLFLLLVHPLIPFFSFLFFNPIISFWIFRFFIDL